MYVASCYASKCPILFYLAFHQVGNWRNLRGSAEYETHPGRRGLAGYAILRGEVSGENHVETPLGL